MMPKWVRTYQLCFLAAATILGLSAVYVRSHWLPLARANQWPLPVFSTLPDFHLTNQSARVVSLESLRGQPWIADFIFTRCAGPCPRMTREMSRLQSSLSKFPGVKLVTITADPEHDTPEVLQRYGEKFGADASRWSLLTGEKRQIQHLAVDGFKVVAAENSAADPTAGEDLFIHSTKFMLVDQSGHIRAYYDSTEPGVENKVLADLAKLRR